MADVRFNVTLLERQHDWLRQRAFEHRVSMAEVVRRVMDQAMASDAWQPVHGTVESKRDCIDILRGEIAEIERVRDRVQAQACANDMADTVAGLQGDYAVIHEALIALRTQKQRGIMRLQSDIRDLSGDGEIDLMAELLDPGQEPPR